MTTDRHRVSLGVGESALELVVTVIQLYEYTNVYSKVVYVMVCELDLGQGMGSTES